jgi:hypothetical protein
MLDFNRHNQALELAHRRGPGPDLDSSSYTKELEEVARVLRLTEAGFMDLSGLACKAAKLSEDCSSGLARIISGEIQQDALKEWTKTFSQIRK